MAQDLELPADVDVDVAVNAVVGVVVERAAGRPGKRDRLFAGRSTMGLRQCSKTPVRTLSIQLHAIIQ